MDFALSEFQQLLKEQAERFIERDYGFEQRRALVASDTGYSEAHWQTFAELGWLGLPFDEAHGGFGGTAADLGLLFDAFGHGDQVGIGRHIGACLFDNSTEVARRHGEHDHVGSLQRGL
mgnify:CR=1 FL=1